MDLSEFNEQHAYWEVKVRDEGNKRKKYTFGCMESRKKYFKQSDCHNTDRGGPKQWMWVG